MSVIEADRYLALKARVKAECLRRKYSGSVETFGGVDYDFISQPADGKTVLLEHQNKLVEPLRRIKDGAYSAPGAQVQESDLAEMESIVTALEAVAVDNRNTGGCDADCTGLCYSGCASGCRGGCQNGCSNCGSTCTDSCSGRCGGNCRGSCSGTCQDGCYGGCKGTCTRDCASSCGQNCSTYCTNICTGCGAGCAGYMSAN